MTCREKLKQGHPARIEVLCIGGCFGCPEDYGYNAKELCKNLSDETSMYETCTACWDQELEVEE